MCLILGVGLLRYLGGALKYADYLVLSLSWKVPINEELWALLPAERARGRFLSALSTSTVCEVQC